MMFPSMSEPETISPVARKLMRLHGQPTRYELAAIRGGDRVLICYACAKGRTDLWKGATDPKRVHQLIAMTGAEHMTFAKRAADGGVMGDWSIRFTGRTQRDAVTEGELAYIGDLENRRAGA